MPFFAAKRPSGGSSTSNMVLFWYQMGVSDYAIGEARWLSMKGRVMKQASATVRMLSMGQCGLAKP